jgi:hypothetical protein
MVQNSFAGEKLLTSGWGYYDVADPKKSSVLKVAIVNGISNADCKAAFGAYGVRQFKSFTTLKKSSLLNTNRKHSVRQIMNI